MPRRTPAVTQADVARAIRGARAAGLHVQRVVVRRDGVSIETSETPIAPGEAAGPEARADDSVRPVIIL